MKKIIKLNESDLIKIVGRVLNEQGSMTGTAGYGLPGYRQDDFRNQGKSVEKKENINPKNLKLGDGGKNHPEQIDDVKELQQILINKKYLSLPPNTPLGYFGNLTNKALETYNQKNKIQSNPQSREAKEINIKGNFLDCVKNSQSKTIITLEDKTNAISINNYIFYSNGRVKSPKGGMGTYFCYKDGVKIKNGTGDSEYVETGVNTPYRKTSPFSGGITGYYRKMYPNIAQMFFTKPLTNEDFTEGQKQVVFNVIQRAIARGGNNTRERGCAIYKDYSDDIDKKLNTKSGASTLDSIIGTLTDVKFQIATLLGQFCYTLNSDGSYTVRDTYDFSKGSSYRATKKDLEGKTYPQQLWFVMNKSNSTPYRAAREIAYLEHPDTDPEWLKTPMVLTIDSGYYAKNKGQNTSTSNVA